MNQSCDELLTLAINWYRDSGAAPTPFFYVSICMANSHCRLIHVDVCDQSESSITNAGLGSLTAAFRLWCAPPSLEWVSWSKAYFAGCWVSVPAARLC